MDETTYSHPSVIELINRDYVPIRVDNDVRPDINQRYNMGGWPTTAFLTATGDILTGGTYMPPDQMASALMRIADYYRANQAEIASRVLDARKRAASGVARSAGELEAASSAQILRIGHVGLRPRVRRLRQRAQISRRPTRFSYCWSRRRCTRTTASARWLC